MISENDLEWLKWNYPGVYYVPTKGILQGCLWFKMNYSFLTGEGVINPPDEMNLENSLTLEDAYEITIEIDSIKRKVIVREIGGRIIRTKNKWKLSYADVHMYQDQTLCLCPEPEERLLFYTGFSLKHLFYDYLIPNLYYQTYLNKHGKEPWKSSGHGEMGILESYAKNKFSELNIDTIVNSYLESLAINLVNLVTSKRKIDHNLLCICDSGKMFRDCHPQGFYGLRKLYEGYWIMKTGKSNK